MSLAETLREFCSERHIRGRHTASLRSLIGDIKFDYLVEVFTGKVPPVPFSNGEVTCGTHFHTM